MSDVEDLVREAHLAELEQEKRIHEQALDRIEAAIATLTVRPA